MRGGSTQHPRRAVRLGRPSWRLARREGRRPREAIGHVRAWRGAEVPFGTHRVMLIQAGRAGAGRGAADISPSRARGAGVDTCASPRGVSKGVGRRRHCAAPGGWLGQWARPAALHRARGAT